MKVAYISNLDIGRFLAKQGSIYHDFAVHYFTECCRYSCAVVIPVFCNWSCPEYEQRCLKSTSQKTFMLR